LGEACVPAAVQREALAERCTAEPGPFQAPAFVTIPGLQRTAARCAAPGIPYTAIPLTKALGFPIVALMSGLFAICGICPEIIS